MDTFVYKSFTLKRKYFMFLYKLYVLRFEVKQFLRFPLNIANDCSQILIKCGNNVFQCITTVHSYWTFKYISQLPWGLSFLSYRLIITTQQFKNANEELTELSLYNVKNQNYFTTAWSPNEHACHQHNNVKFNRKLQHPHPHQNVLSENCSI